MIITVDPDSVRTACYGLAGSHEYSPATRLLLRQHAGVCRHGVGVTLKCTCFRNLNNAE